MASNAQADNDKRSYPTITIVDSSDGRQGLALDDISMSYCCVCIPEHVGVAAILSLNTLYGLLSSIASFAGLTIYNEPKDRPILIISGILYIIMCLTGILGTIALRQNNIIAMRRISISIWIHTILSFIFNGIIYILEIVFKDDIIGSCQAELTTDDNRINCEQVANVYLIKEAFRILFIEFFLIYFTYVVYHYAYRTMGSQKNLVPYVDGQITPTYVVYSTGPPTSRDWVPPPTFVVRSNDSIPSDTKDKNQSIV